MKSYNQRTIFDHYLDNRKEPNNKFLSKITKIINWKEIEKILKKDYPKGQSATGRQCYPPLLLFKIVLLQTWYGLSDYEVETQINDRISFIKFLGLRLRDEVPDHSSICRFRKIIINKGTMEKVLKTVNKYLETTGILIKQGAIIDASITETERKPKGKKQYELIEKEGSKLKEVPKAGVDKEGSWTKKGGRLQYGYKKHYVCDSKTSLVISVETSTAREHDSKYLKSSIAKSNLKKGSNVYADKGYYGQEHTKMLLEKGLKSRIQSKAQRNKPLMKLEKVRNKLISKTRYKVERIFGGIKKWFKSGICRYVGIKKTHYQHVLEALCYNLKILPNLKFSIPSK